MAFFKTIKIGVSYERDQLFRRSPASNPRVIEYFNTRKKYKNDLVIFDVENGKSQLLHDFVYHESEQFIDISSDQLKQIENYYTSYRQTLKNHGLEDTISALKAECDNYVSESKISGLNAKYVRISKAYDFFETWFDAIGYLWGGGLDDLESNFKSQIDKCLSVELDRFFVEVFTERLFQVKNEYDEPAYTKEQHIDFLEYHLDGFKQEPKHFLSHLVKIFEQAKQDPKSYKASSFIADFVEEKAKSYNLKLEAKQGSDEAKMPIRALALCFWYLTEKKEYKQPESNGVECWHKEITSKYGFKHHKKHQIAYNKMNDPINRRTVIEMYPIQIELFLKDYPKAKQAFISERKLIT